MVAIDHEASQDGRQLVGAARDGVVGAALDGHEVLGGLAEVLVAAGGAQLVVAGHGIGQGGGIDVRELPIVLCGVGVHGLGQALNRIGGNPLLGVHLVVAVVLGDVVGAGGLPLLVVALPVRGHQAEELRRRGVRETGLRQIRAGKVVHVAHAAAGLVHEAVALLVDEEEGHLQAHGRRLAVDHLGVGVRRHDGPGVHAGHQSAAVAEIGEQREALSVRRVVVEHLLVGGVVAAGQNDALGRREQVVRPVGVLADGARDRAGLVSGQLLAGHVVEELGAGGGQVLGNHRGGGVVVALHVEIGVGMQVDVVAVVGEHGVVGLAFHAALRRLLGPPGQRLLGIVGPDVHEVAVGAVVALPVDEAHAGLDGGLVGLGEVDGGGHVAGGLGGVDVLHAGHARPGLERGVHGGQARLAGADHDDVVLVGLGEIGDGLLGREERGAGSGARVGQALLGGGLGDGLGLAAAGERAGAGHAERGQAAELEQIATSNGGGHGELPLFPLRGTPLMRPRASPCAGRSFAPCALSGAARPP